MKNDPKHATELLFGLPSHFSYMVTEWVSLLELEEASTDVYSMFCHSNLNWIKPLEEKKGPVHSLQPFVFNYNFGVRKPQKSKSFFYHISLRKNVHFVRLTKHTEETCVG